LAKLLVNSCNDIESIRGDISSLLEWILNLDIRFDDHITSSINLKQVMKEPCRETIKMVIAAMGASGGYNYGTSASSHWF